MLSIKYYFLLTVTIITATNIQAMNDLEKNAKIAQLHKAIDEVSPNQVINALVNGADPALWRDSFDAFKKAQFAKNTVSKVDARTQKDAQLIIDTLDIYRGTFNTKNIKDIKETVFYNNLALSLSTKESASIFCTIINKFNDSQQLFEQNVQMPLLNYIAEKNNPFLVGFVLQKKFAAEQKNITHDFLAKIELKKKPTLIDSGKETLKVIGYTTGIAYIWSWYNQEKEIVNTTTTNSKIQHKITNELFSAYQLAKDKKHKKFGKEMLAMIRRVNLIYAESKKLKVPIEIKFLIWSFNPELQ